MAAAAPPAWLLDAAALGRACTDAVHAAGLQPVGQLFHEFRPRRMALAG